MELKQLETFVRVAELGSFSKAALVLRVAQPALSRQVRQLETELRENLLERTGRGVRMTEAGKLLFDHAVSILQMTARARDEIGAQRDKPIGRVVVGMPPSIARQLAPALVGAFRQQCPAARLSLVEGLSAHLMEWIASGRVDLALVHNPEPSDTIELTPLLEEALCLVSPVAAPAGTRRPARRAAPIAPARLAELPGYPLVLPDRTHTIRRLLEERMAGLGLRLDVAWEVSSVPAIIDLVALGHGHAVLADSAVRISGKADRLLTRRLVEPQLTSTLFLARSGTRRATPLARHVATILTRLAGGLPRG